MVCVGELGPWGGTQGPRETHLLCTCGKSHACPSGLHVGSSCKQDPPETQMVTPSSLLRETEARVWRQVHRRTSTRQVHHTYTRCL